MTVQEIAAGGHTYSVSGTSYAFDGKIERTDAKSEGALITGAAKAGLFMEKEQAQCKRLDTIPFESHYQYMATLHADLQGRDTLVYVKGSVEAIVERCTSALDPRGSAVALDAPAIHVAVDAMAAKDFRVLAFAQKKLESGIQKIDHKDIKTGLIFLGLQGISTRPGARPSRRYTTVTAPASRLR